MGRFKKKSMSSSGQSQRNISIAIKKIYIYIVTLNWFGLTYCQCHVVTKIIKWQKNANKIDKDMPNLL